MSNEINNFLNLLNNKRNFNYIQQKIKYFSYFSDSFDQNKVIFNNHKYNQNIIKPLKDDIIIQFLMISINKFIENQNNKIINKDILFISKIIGKLYIEKFIDKNVIIKISTYLLEYKQYEGFFEILSTSKVGELLNEIQEKDFKKNEIIEIRNILIQNSKFIKNILLLDPNEFKPYKYLSSLFQFKFNLNLLNLDLLLNDFNYNNKYYLNKNFIVNIFKTLLELFEKEEKLQKTDIIRGLYTKEGFKYTNKILLVEKFNINLSFKIYYKQNEIFEEFNIFKLYNNDNNENLIKLYFDDRYNLKLKYYSNDFIILSGKHMDLNHIHSLKINFLKESGWLNNYSEKIKIILDGQEHIFDSDTPIDGEEYNLSFGEYNGELNEFSIMNNKKEIFKINFLSLYNLYKYNLFKKEFIIDHQNSKLINTNIKNNMEKKSKHKKLKSQNDFSKEELNYLDYFFENKKTIIKFLDEYGLEYISSILIYLTNQVSKNENNNDMISYTDIYEILNIFWDLFQYLYNILIQRANGKDKKNSSPFNNKYYFKKLMTILYSYSILQSILSEKLKMPEILINKIVDFLKTLSENNSSLVTKSFFNHILMIILTQQNTYNIPFDKISIFLNYLISSKELNYYLDCYISILIDLFFNQRKLKEIKKILSMFIDNFSDTYLIKYIIIFQQFSLNKNDVNDISNNNKENEIEYNNNNYEFSYKVLKLIYKSKIWGKTNIVDKPDTDIILYNFQKILQLSNCNLNKKESKNLKEDEEQNLEEDLSSDEELSHNESEENNQNYLTKLKAISIRIIDQFIIKKYHGMGRKSMLVKDEKYNRAKSSIAILFSIHNLDLYLIRSLLLTSFDTPNELGLRFIKHGLDSDGINISELKLIESFTSIKFMFSIFDILKNKNHKNYYFEFIKLFMGETMKKIRLFANSSESISISYKKNYSMNIFEYKKIGILLYNIIIELKKMPENSELNFTAEYLTNVIENILFLHPNSFFFNLVLDLIKDYIRDENVYEYNYIIKMMKTFVKLLNYENIEKNEKFINNIYLLKNYQMNCLKYLSLIYELVHLYDEEDINSKKKENNIIFEDGEHENIIEYTFKNFMIFINNNLSNPLLYSSIILNKENNQIILEIIFEIFCTYYIYYPCEERKITQLLKSLIYPNLIKKSKEKNIITILCFIDLFKDRIKEDKKYEIIMKISELEQNLFKTREINMINYFFTLKILKLIISQICVIMKINKNQKIKKIIDKNDDGTYYNFLYILMINIIEELNTFYLKDITKKYRIKTLDNEYNKFRVKIENCLLRKENLENIFDKYILENNEQLIESDSDSLSLYSNKNTEQEGDDKSVLSGNSSISIKPTEKFKFKNADGLIEKNIKYDNIYKKMNINNIKFWIKEIDLDGIFLIFKNNRIVKRGIFSAFLNQENLYDDIFINKIIPEFHNYTHYKNNSELNNNILYPTQLKNYITSIYTKPFLKPYKNLYSESAFSITHKYFVHLQNKNNFPVEKNEIPFVFDEIKEIKCELITNKGSIYCNLYLKDDFLILKSCNEKIQNPKDYHLFSSTKYVELKKLIILPYCNIKEILTRRFLYMYQACEIFTIDNKSYYINFFERKVLIEGFYNEVKDKYPNIQNKIIENVRDVFDFKHFIEDWNNNKIDTFYFLNMLNKYSSRSYNDLQQYPVFPWLFHLYNSELLENNKFNLLSSLQNNPKLNILKKLLYESFLRQFQYPISAQTEEKRKEIILRYEKSFFKFKCHYNSHYSTNAIIFYFLVRISPITEEHVKFQGDQFDKIERMFFGLDSFLKVIDFLKDSRELIPDLFYLYEMYFNMNYNFFGYSHNKKMILNNIVIPSENMTPIEFVYFNRAQLNSNLISENINSWINNVFGVNQLQNSDSDKMKYSCNIYPWQCYEKMFRKNYDLYKKNKDISNKRRQSVHTSSKKISLDPSLINVNDDDEFPIDSYNLKDQLNTICLFGQCPVELLKRYLTKRGKHIDNNNFNLILAKQKTQKEEKEIKEDNDKENKIKNKKINEKKIVYVSYINDNYIIYINNKKNLIVLNQEDFSEKYKFIIIGNFIPLTSSIVIEFNNCETLIISNVMEEKIILAEKGVLKYQHKICDIPTCLCKCSSNDFYVGTINGYIQKIKMSFKSDKNNFKEINNIIDEKKILAHKYKLVREIIYNSKLNIIISLGDDNRIIIRNEAFYELLTIIDLSLYINKNLLNFNKNKLIDFNSDFINGNKILLNNYDTLYYLNKYSGCIISFTINGMKISKKYLIDIYQNDFNENRILSSYLINIYDEFRFLYCDSNKNKIIEYNPVNFDEIFFEYDLNLNNLQIEKKYEIKAIFYNKRDKCFNIWVKMENNFEIIKYNLIEKFDKIDVKKNLVSKEDNIISSSKKMKMEKFAQRKGQFKTTLSIGVNKNNINRQLFP